MKNFLVMSLLVLFVGNMTVVQAQEKRALVIGNAQYKNGWGLLTPLNDAQLIANALRSPEIGFKVSVLTNGTLASMKKAIDNFSKSLKPNDVSLVYFTGMGVQLEGQNYLLPVDAEIKYSRHIKKQTIAVNHLLSRLSDNQLIFIDAGRDSFGSSTRGIGSIKTNNVQRFTLFSTQQGKQAFDSIGNNKLNSSFARALATYIKEPSLDLNELGRKVQAQVRKESNNQQIPYYSNSFMAKYCFVGCK